MRKTYVVEAIKWGTKKSIMSPEYATREEAESVAKRALQAGHGIAVERLTEYDNGHLSQKTILQRGLHLTKIKSGKYGNKFTKDFGKFMGKKKHQQIPFGIHIPKMW